MTTTVPKTRSLKERLSLESAYAANKAMNADWSAWQQARFSLKAKKKGVSFDELLSSSTTKGKTDWVKVAQDRNWSYQPETTSKEVTDLKACYELSKLIYQAFKKQDPNHTELLGASVVTALVASTNATKIVGDIVRNICNTLRDRYNACAVNYNNLVRVYDSIKDREAPLQREYVAKESEKLKAKFQELVAAQEWAIVILAEWQRVYPELENQALESAMAQVSSLISNVGEMFVKDRELVKLQTAHKLEQSLKDSIFSILDNPQDVEFLLEEHLEAVLASVQEAKDAKESWVPKALGLPNGVYDALKEMYSWSYPLTEEDRAERADKAFQEAQLRATEILIRTNAAAAKQWKSKYVLKFRNPIGDESPVYVGTTYIGDSITTSGGDGTLADSVLFDKNNPPTEAQLEWLCKASAQFLDSPMMSSPGGGLAILTEGFCLQYQPVSNGVVDFKAYIASAQNAAVVAIRKVKAALGTKGWYLVKDGKTMMEDGKPVFIYDENEGSHWMKVACALSFGLMDEKMLYVMQHRTFDSKFMDLLRKVGISMQQLIDLETAYGGTLFFGIKIITVMVYHFLNGQKEKAVKAMSFFNHKGESSPEVKVANELKTELKAIGRQIWLSLEGKENDLDTHWKAFLEATIEEAKGVTITQMKERISGKLANSWKGILLKPEEYKKLLSKHLKVPEYKREEIFGMESPLNTAMFGKGIYIPDAATWEHLNGAPFDFDVVLNTEDGIKCDLKKFATKKVSSILTSSHTIKSARFLRGMKDQGWSAVPKAFILSPTSEEVEVGVMKTFLHTSKVRIASQWIEKIAPNLHGFKGGVAANQQSSEAFKAYWSKDKIEVYNKLRSALKAVGSPSSTDWSEKLDWDSLSLPNGLINDLLSIKYRNLVEPGYWARKNESLQKGQYGNLLKLLNEIDFTGQSYGAFSNKVDSFEANIREACKGGGIRGSNMVAVHSAIAPDNCIFLPSWMRIQLGFAKNARPTVAVGRYPIATATSVTLYTIIFSDDKEFAAVLKEAGYVTQHGMPCFVLINELGKFFFQMDDDGDTLAILPEGKVPSELELLQLLDGIAEGDTFAIKDAYRLLESWVAVSLTMLERDDLVSTAIEMDAFGGGKASFRVIESGKISQQFKDLAYKDLRGPVGLVTDLLSVVLAMGITGKMLIRYVWCLGYMLQHSVDSCKKTKLPVPGGILMGFLPGDRKPKMDLWHYDTETKCWVIPDANNKALIAWHQAWKTVKFTKTDEKVAVSGLDEIRKLEKAYDFIPTVEELVEVLKWDNNVLAWLPGSLIQQLSNFAKPGISSVYLIVDGNETEVILAHEINSIMDPEVYMMEQVLAIAPEGLGSWNGFASYRKPSASELFHIAYTKENQPFWVMAPNAAGFPARWWNQKVTGYFEGNLNDSICNTIYKNMDRWAVELAFSQPKEVRNHVNKHGRFPDSEIVWSHKNDFSNYSPGCEYPIAKTWQLIQGNFDAKVDAAWLQKHGHEQKSFDEVLYDNSLRPKLLKAIFYGWLEEIKPSIEKEDGLHLNNAQKVLERVVSSKLGKEWFLQPGEKAWKIKPETLKDARGKNLPVHDSQEQWESKIVAIILDFLFLKISGHSVFSPCDYTKNIDLGDDTSEWRSKIAKYAIEHEALILDEDSAEDDEDGFEAVGLVQCHHCVAEIRRQMKAVYRKMDKDSPEAKSALLQRRKADATKANLMSLFEQHQYVANGGSSEGMNVTEQSVRSWVNAYGSKELKKAFGIEDITASIKKWGRAFGQLSKDDKKSFKVWLSQVGSLADFKIEELLELLKAWKEDPNKPPTPPSGGKAAFDLPEEDEQESVEDEVPVMETNPTHSPSPMPKQVVGNCQPPVQAPLFDQPSGSITYGKGQLEAISKILSELNDGVFACSLSGAAGTGKTTVLLEIIRQWQGSVAFCAPTGAAVKVMEKKLENLGDFALSRKIVSIGTLQSSFMKPEVKDGKLKFEIRKQSILTDCHDRLLIIVDETSMLEGSLGMKLEQGVRELHTNAHILYVGDYFQLEPVGGEAHIELKGADAVLTEVYRQAGDSNILKLATRLRGGDIGEPVFNKADLHQRTNLNVRDIASMATVPMDSIPEDHKQSVLEEELVINNTCIKMQVICHSNPTRIKVNREIRKKIGFPAGMQAGDLLTIFSNGGDYVNSEQVYVHDVKDATEVSSLLGVPMVMASLSRDPNKAPESIMPSLLFKEGCSLVKDHINYKTPPTKAAILKVVESKIVQALSPEDQESYKLYKRDCPSVMASKDFRYIRQWKSQFSEEVKAAVEKYSQLSCKFDCYLQADFGYAITCHKAQGNQWSRVCILREKSSKMIRKDHPFKTQEEQKLSNRKWLYTGLTRAEKIAVLVDYNTWIN